MAKIEFWDEEKDNLEKIRRLSKQGYRIVCGSKEKVVDNKTKMCVLLDPSQNPKQVNELCERISFDSVIYILMTKQDFFRKYPYQRFKLPIKDDKYE